MEDIILVGYGGHAKSIADCIERQGKYRIFGYTDLNKHDCKYRYLGKDDVLKTYLDMNCKNVVIAIGYLGKGKQREILYNQLSDLGFKFPIIVDPSAIIAEDVQIGEGTVIGKNVVINADSVIGKMVILNTNAIVEHDCYVGDFSHISVATVLCGGVKIGFASFVGANSTIIQQQTIGDRVIVPAGKTIR